MSQSKTYLKFKETRSQEDLETLNSYLKRLSEISDILNGDEDLDNETERFLGGYYRGPNRGLMYNLSGIT